ncbi:AAA domain-containing protein [Desulfitobacterium sp. THU1]|uniref:AAA domain-containing protein n=1 Tax=Desulfitobacterium sp. THU1 TaxID=3138072 RepID=UPI00311F9A15
MGKELNESISNKIVLPELLTEFREAIEAEITASKKKASSNAVPLVNGKRIAQNANQFQYIFTIESILNTPDGSPAELIIQGRAPIETTIVQLEEVRITLSTSVDLGDFVPFARLQSNLSILLKKLISRIEDNSQNDNVVGMRMLGALPIDNVTKIDDLSGLEDLNLNQKKAVVSAIERNMTFIWGPPGTGKTKTIGNIINELYKRNRTVLLVSHTNIAVDQALMKVAKSVDTNDLENGCILRLGTPSNPELNDNFPEVMMSYQISHRAKELEIQLKYKTDNVETIQDDIRKLYRQIAEYKWYCGYSAIRDDLCIILERYKEDSMEQSEILECINKLTLEKDELPNINAIKEYLSLKDRLSKNEEKINKAKRKHDSLINELNVLKNRLDEVNSILTLFDRSSEIKKELSQKVSLSSQYQILKRLENDINAVQTDIETKTTELSRQENLLVIAKQTNKISRALRGIPSPEQLTKEISNMRNTILNLNIMLKEKNLGYGKQHSVYQEIYNLQEELKSINLIETNRSNVEVKYFDLIGQIERSKQQIEGNAAKTEHLNELSYDLMEQINRTEIGFSNESQKALNKYIFIEESINNYHKQQSKLTERVDLYKDALNTYFKNNSPTPFLNNSNYNDSSYDEQFEFLERMYKSNGITLKNVNIDQIESNIKLLKDIEVELRVELAEIKKKLAEIEKEIISQAKIVGTTLTKAYLSDEMQSRKFDTIVLDEASMAPIPTLWVATLLAENNAVIVGDFKQLPPIVLSDVEIAKKWIGNDIFERSGIKAKYEQGCPPDYFIILNEQYRMEREIAEIANRYYDGKLLSPPSMERNLERLEFDSWCNDSLLSESPVVLVDTENLNAWVTSVTRGNQSSRLNFLSATLSVNLAERLISNYSLNDNKREKTSKILIVSPYRPHTKLIDLLLRDIKIEDQLIRAGTIHSFQGAEADIVIFDLVVDEPHFRVNLFMHTNEITEQMRRLFNVAITRARFKLLIIGDFKYCLSKGKNSELGDLLNYLIYNQKFPRIDATQIAPTLHEQSLKAQRILVGGRIEKAEERFVVTQESFYSYLSPDLENAKNEIVIYSPFITKDRLSYLQPQLQVAVNRGVKVFIITKSLQERNKSELSTYRELEDHISEIGIVLIHKMRMHEKLVFIDDDIVWTGSLNPLSFSSTQEIMERRQSKDVQKDYKEVLRLSELTNYINKQEAKCPICGSEVIAAEGKDAPFYWRCINDNCFTRGIDQQYPMNGELTCATCGGEFNFGYWGEAPSWRCTVNKRHHMTLYRSHLKLPNMANKVPKRDLIKIRNYLDEVYPEKSKIETKQNTTGQMSLFDDL